MRTITLYRFNQGAHTIAGGLKWEQAGAEPPRPETPLTLTTEHKNFVVVFCCITMNIPE